MTQDEYHLRLLAKAHNVIGALIFVFALFVGFQLIVSLSIFGASSQAEPMGSQLRMAGWGMALLGGAMMAIYLALAFLIGGVGWYLNRRKNYTYCIVVSALECIFVPIGTVLGILTLIVLLRPSVRELFGLEGIDASTRPDRT